MAQFSIEGYKFNDGEFLRPESKFRHWVKADGTTPFLPEKDRYHLYVSLACPWSHRTVIVRKLRKLDHVIGLSVTHPVWNDQGWCFKEGPGVIPDQVNKKMNIIDLYRLVDPHFSGAETVPILWDKKRNTLVNNESSEIMRMFNTEFRSLGDPSVDLYPSRLSAEIDRLIQSMYDPINNGVYKTGFAQTQGAYDRAVKKLFQALEEFEKKLEDKKFLCGEDLTEADIALFVTLIRFDLVYYFHFKCNLKPIRDFKNLSKWLAEVYRVPGIAETCNFGHIKHHYYECHVDINPYGIVPVGPVIQFES